MPYYQFTEAEKQAMREKYRADIEKINSYIQQGCDNNHIDSAPYKYKIDMEAFEKKLNDPTEVYLYRKGKEFAAREAKQKSIQAQLKAELEPQYRDPNKVYPLNRFVHTDLIPSDDPEAMAYNRTVMKLYYQHPEAYVQNRMQRFMKMETKQLADIAKCDDTRGLMQAWGYRHYGEMEDSFEFYNVIKDYPQDMISPEMLKYHGAFDRNFETMMDPSDLCKRINDSYLYMPKTLTEAQAQLIEGTDFSFEDRELYDAFMRNTSLGVSLDVKPAQFKNYYKNVQKVGVDLNDPQALQKYIVKCDAGGDPYGTLNNFIGTKQALVNPKLYKIPDQDLDGIHKVFKKDYVKEIGFQMPEIPDKFKPHGIEPARSDLNFKYAIKYNLKIGELERDGFGKIAEQIKGNIGERMFNKTSLEWKHLMQTMKDFDNPNHVAYQNSMPSKLAANQYLMHKGVKSLEDINRLSGTAKERAQLAWDVIDTFQKYEDPNSPKIVPGTNKVVNKPDRWPAIEDEADLGDDFVLMEHGQEFGAKEAQNEVQKEEEAENINEIQIENN